MVGKQITLAVTAIHRMLCNETKMIIYYEVKHIT